MINKPEKHQILVKGLGVCSGTVEGQVKIVYDPSQIDTLSENTILVVPDTNPSWVPLLLQAKGIITNMGNLLCHAAIVAREFEIPCIVGTINATEILKDGMIIKIDSLKGLIYNV